jgi:two-component system CheB/CheR fusion protein
MQQDSLRVLVADDNRDVVFGLLMLLRQWGYDGVAAYDGPSALDAAAANPHDVVFLDICLPRLDGFEVARRLRQLPGMANALLIAITGYAQDADVQRWKEAGIDCHFLKPVDPAEIQTQFAREAGP